MEVTQVKILDNTNIYIEFFHKNLESFIVETDILQDWLKKNNPDLIESYTTKLYSGWAVSRMIDWFSIYQLFEENINCQLKFLKYVLTNKESNCITVYV